MAVLARWVCTLLLAAVTVGGWRYDPWTNRWVPTDDRPAPRQDTIGRQAQPTFDGGYRQYFQQQYQQQDDFSLRQSGNPPPADEAKKEPMKAKSVECKKKTKSGRCLSRQERQLLLPNGFSLAVEPKVGFNLYSNDQMGTLRVLVKTDISYKPPAALVDASGRSIKSSRLTMHKHVIYNTIKTTMSRFGVDGDACLQRAVCEVAEAPLRRDGMIGEILNMILSPSHRLDQTDSSPEVDKLLKAELRGRQQGDCDFAYPSCPLSLFNVVDAASDYTGSVLDALADHDDADLVDDEELVSA